MSASGRRIEVLLTYNGQEVSRTSGAGACTNKQGSRCASGKNPEGYRRITPAPQSIRKLGRSAVVPWRW